jgi:hypothetical protein
MEFFRYYGAFIAGIIICKNNRVYPYHAITVITGMLIGILGIYSSLGIHTVDGIQAIPNLLSITFFLLAIIIPLICSYLAFKYAHRFYFAHRLISGISFGSYPVYLFHSRLLVMFGPNVVPLIFIIGYYIQKVELLSKKKVIEALSQISLHP